MKIRLGTISSSLFVLTLFCGQLSAQCAAQYSGTCLLIRGDGNNDGLVNLSDIPFLLTLSAPPCNKDAADVDDNGSYNITDGIVLNNYLFVGHVPPALPPPPPAAPYPSFGCDCTIDALTPPACCAFTTTVQDAGPTTVSSWAQIPTNTEFTGPDTNGRSINLPSCTSPFTQQTHWKANFNYPWTGPGVEPRVLNSCVKSIKFTTDGRFKACIDADGPCGVWPGCASANNLLAVAILPQDAEIELCQIASQTGIILPAALISGGGSSTLTYRLENDPAGGMFCTYVTDLAMAPTPQPEFAGAACTVPDMVITVDWTIPLDSLTAAQTGGSCGPATNWSICRVTIVPKYLYIVQGVADVSENELIYDTGSTIKNLRWVQCN